MDGSIIDRVVQATSEKGVASATALERFLRARSLVDSLVAWLQLEPGDRPPSRAEVTHHLTYCIAALDGLLSEQVDAILHHPRFQQIEAAWRGLRWLCEQIEDGERIKVRVLDLSWRDLIRDLDRASEFDQSQLFRKIYSNEFGMPGGEPFGLLLGDYAIRHKPARDWPYDDILTLRSISQVAAAAFAPFMASVHPSFFGLDGFGELGRPLNLAKTVQQPDYVRWNSFRATEDARFVGLVLPRILLRHPWADDGSQTYGFRYREAVSRPDGSEHLFGSAIWAFGAVVVRCFAAHGWPAAIRGVQLSDDEFRTVEQSGGLVRGPALESFETDERGTIEKCVTDVMITDMQEKELCDLGFIPLCHCPGTSLAAFYGVPSTQKPKQLDTPMANASARLSAMLHYILCVSRFAHYVKMLGREKIGSFATAEECERTLNNWLIQYASANEDASAEMQAEYPLREAKAIVREMPGRPGTYQCIIHLRPHFQLDHMSATVKLVTELAGVQAG